MLTSIWCWEQVALGVVFATRTLPLIVAVHSNSHHQLVFSYDSHLSWSTRVNLPESRCVYKSFTAWHSTDLDLRYGEESRTERWCCETVDVHRTCLQLDLCPSCVSTALNWLWIHWRSDWTNDIKHLVPLDAPVVPQMGTVVQEVLAEIHPQSVCLERVFEVLPTRWSWHVRLVLRMVGV